MRILQPTILALAIVSHACSDQQRYTVPQSSAGDASAKVPEEEFDSEIILPAHQGIELAFDPLSAIPGTNQSGCTVKILREPFKGKAVTDSRIVQIKYTSQSAYSGRDSLLSMLTCEGASKKIRIVIDVKKVNHKPVVNDMNFSLNEDSQSDIVLKGSDDDNDQLSFFVVNPPAKGAIDEKFLKKGKLIYSPPENFNGDVTLTYGATDGIETSATKSIKIVVAPVYDPPVAFDSTINTEEDTAVNGRLLGTRIDGAKLSFVLKQSPSIGEIANFNGETGEYTYIPATGINGTDRFTFAAFDGEGYSNEKTVSVKIAKVNQPVSTEDRSWVTEEDQLGLAIIVPASDGDGDPLTFQISKSPAHGRIGALTINLTERLYYTPDRDYFGSDYFEVAVSDGSTTAISRHTVTINPVNDAPVSQVMSFTIDEDSLLQNRLPGSDTDHDPLTWSICTAPRRGTLQITDPSLGSFTYTPAQDFNGYDTFRYKLSDGELSSECALVTVAVRSVPDTWQPRKLAAYVSNYDHRIRDSLVGATTVDVQSGKLFTIGTTEASGAESSPKRVARCPVDTPTIPGPGCEYANLANWVTRIDAIFPQPDGTVYVAVQIANTAPGLLFTDTDRFYFNGLALIKVTKSLIQDLSFGANGYVRAPDSDKGFETIFIGSPDAVYSAVIRGAKDCSPGVNVYKWSTTGILDMKFGKDGQVVLTSSRGDCRRGVSVNLAIQSGLLLISETEGSTSSTGYGSIMGGVAVFGGVGLSTLTRLKSDGSRDLSVTVQTGLLKTAMHVDSTGNVFVSGANLRYFATAHYCTGNSCPPYVGPFHLILEPTIIKLGSDLSIDSKFGDEGKATLAGMAVVESIQTLANGKIFVGGYDGALDTLLLRAYGGIKPGKGGYCGALVALLLPTGDIFSDFADSGYQRITDSFSWLGVLERPNTKLFATSERTFAIITPYMRELYGIP